MQLALQPTPKRSLNRRNANFLLTATFFAFTYALFTYRAQLRYGDAYDLVAAIRLYPTLIGAGLYWLVLTRLIDGTSLKPSKAMAVLATILPASIIVLLARLILDELGASNPNGLAGDLRFVMVWGGYFGLWVSASFALRIVAQLPFGESPVASILRWNGATTSRQCANPMARAENLERLALEIATLPPSERKVLIQAFEVPSRYETADEFER